ncbi:peptide MFS transporter [Solimicrobium silvestre]|uniref:Amino acid/peptide transporter (Peptide:H+ symporter) n=1 Tax=Solimicrobium silvestre TaxID=2099400 RepID=A0A2S9GXN9_9BURK|nr:peptide MFS transporter [Solimicrobium silvestre]PRC92470.1 Amino acid/peptide transporter (Peptide:H+ symporter) [Solimicrobium silvestre]
MQRATTITTTTILDHPAGLFTLFFTEMWERFSYYGMRALLVLFLISETTKGGWGWNRAEALTLYSWYTGLVYLTPILGGYLADRVLGSRRAVVWGGFIIAAGHACMLFNTPVLFYIGLGLIVSGTGLFKPNISTIVGQLYGKDNQALRDSGYTLFYMGVNAGAFFGILLCGYIGENIAWNYGFALAGIFMMMGALQFYFIQDIFGNIGVLTKNKTLIPPDETPHIVADRLKVICVLSFFTIFFWLAYEQAGGSMTIFAASYTDRVLAGNSGMVFKVVNSLMSIVPTLILSWVLMKLVMISVKRYLFSSLLLLACFTIIWGLLIWMLQRDFSHDQSSIPASWFGVLPAFFIVILAPLFSTLWEKYWQPSGPIKFAVGLILLGLGFAVLAYGALGIPSGASTASVSMAFLVLAYLLHTMGELCISPVGLSYISKLAPSRLLGLMFGVWFINAAIANKLAGSLGSYIDYISTTYSLASFFLIFATIPITAGLIVLLLNKWMLKNMHGVH